MNHLNQEPLDFAAAVSLLRSCRNERQALDLGNRQQRLQIDQLEREIAVAIALLRELNDALALPGWLQPRVDAVLDRAEEKT